MRVLLVEDDLQLGEAIQSGLKAYHYTVDWLTDGQQALYALTQSQESFDLVIMDLGLPHIDGLDIIKTIREQKGQVPILILSARDTSENIVQGLDNGADDYLTKPFDFSVLNSRIAALLRRKSHNITDHTISIGQVSLNPKSHQVSVLGESVAFSRHEFKILHRLMEHRGEVLSREKITQLLYGWGDDVDSNTIEVHMHSIRKKLQGCLPIKTIRGVGYMIEAQ